MCKLFIILNVMLKTILEEKGFLGLSVRNTHNHVGPQRIQADNACRPYCHEIKQMADNFHVVLSTCPTQESAERIARCVVEARLAACVNVLPGLRSYYEWKGNIEVGDEILLVIKSRVELFDALQSMITSQHPYELPELITVPISTGSPPYLAWLAANMRTAP